MANWQRAGGKKSTYPKPIVPTANEEVFTGPGRSFAEVDALFAKFHEEAVTDGS